MSLATRTRVSEWAPYEEQSRWSIHHIRHALLPPWLAKRHFHVPSINSVGISLPEVLISIALMLCVVLVFGTRQLGEAKDSGKTAQLLCIPLFVMITYRSVVTWLTGVSFERSCFWHAYLALVATGYSIFHGLITITGGIKQEDAWHPEESDMQHFKALFTSHRHKNLYISGVCIVSCMILLILTSIKPIRTYFKRSWLVLHHVLLIPFVLSGMYHGAVCILIGLGLYMMDRMYSYVIETNFYYKSISTLGKVKVISDQLIRVSFPNSLHFIPGQYLNLRIPSIALFEYHKFSICSIPTDHEIVLFIRPDGKWTRRMKNTIGHEDSMKHTSSVSVNCYFHSPMGNISLDWMSSRYNCFILFAGGIGITPLISMFRHLKNQYHRGRPLELVHLIWTVKDRSMVDEIMTSIIQVQESELENNYLDMFHSKLFITNNDSDEEEAEAEESYAYFAEKHTNEVKVLGKVEWNKGRPDIQQVFESFNEQVEKEDEYKNGNDVQKGLLTSMTRSVKRRVGVLGCGPSSLTRSVCNAARYASDGKMVYDVHLEQFD